MKGTEILYSGPESGGLLSPFFETEDGLRFTPEQWRLAELMERLEKKVDALIAALGEEACAAKEGK